MNLIVRVRSRLENKSAEEIRLEEAKKSGMGVTFMKMHDDATKTLEEQVQKLGVERKQLENMVDAKTG